LQIVHGKHSSMIKRVYLDHTATTPVAPEVVDAMLPYFRETYGNASSVHWFGQRAKEALERARGTIARAIGAEPGEVFFTSGGTEADNLAIVGSAHAGRSRGKNHVVTTKAEHHAVLEPCDRLAEEGFAVTSLPVDGFGSTDADHVRAVVGGSTALVSVMLANNEVGSISPVRQIAEAAHACGARMHTDAAQAFGKIPVDAGDLDVDLMTLSAHKMYGPKGIGALYVRRGTDLDPMLRGGGQERGKRPGTESVALAVGFAKAVELALAGLATESARLRGFRDRLERELCVALPEIILNGDPSHRLPHVANISFDSSKVKLEGEMLVMNMDLRGIAVTSGSACSSGSMQPSHVLLAMGRDQATARATLRFSFGRGNSEEDVEYAVSQLREVIAQMRPR